MIGQTEIGVRLELHQFRFRPSAIVSVRKLVQFEPDTNCYTALLPRRLEVTSARRIEHILESYGNVARAARPPLTRSFGVGHHEAQRDS
jgi:hypothetical protein